MENTMEREEIEYILRLYGFEEGSSTQKLYLRHTDDNGYVKLIFGVTLESGKTLVIKILHEDDDLTQERQKTDKQSAFSEAMRSYGIRTPVRYQANGKYCNEYIY